MGDDCAAIQAANVKAMDTSISVPKECSAMTAVPLEADGANESKSSSGLGNEKDSVGDSLSSATASFLSLDMKAISAALSRFKFDPRLAVALRVPASAQSTISSSFQSLPLPPPPPPLDFHRVYSSVDTLLAVHEQQALQVYAESCPQMLALDKEIDSSEALLSEVESRLCTLSEDLGVSGADTRQVEQQSSALATRARNRREAYLLLRTYLQQITLTRDLVKTVCEGSLDDHTTFLTALRELEKKIEHARQPGMRKYKSTEASLPELYRLRDCATQRIVTYLQHKFALLRQPRTNINIIQRAELLRHKELFLFLTDQAPEMAIAVKDDYGTGSFVASARQVMDFIYRLGSSGSSCSHAGQTQYISCLGTRDSILQQLDSDPLIAITPPPASRAGRVSSVSSGGNSVSQNASSSESPVGVGSAGTLQSELGNAFTHDHEREPSQTSVQYYEQLFRSYQKLLTDTATTELIFLTDFFLNAGLGVHYQTLFDEVFAKTKAFFISSLQDFLQATPDAIGLALMLRINQYYGQMMIRRKNPCLSSYFKQVDELLYRRLDEVLDISVKTLRSTKPEELLSSPPADGQHVAHTHPMALSFAELASSLAYLQQPLYNLAALPEEPLKSKLEELQEVTLNLLVGLSQELPERRTRLVFLINNYDAISNMLHERSVLPEASNKLEQAMWEHVERYIDEQMNQHFADLLSAVVAAEGALKTDPSPVNPAEVVDLELIERAVLTFHASWREKITQLHEDSVSSFSRLTNAMEILKQVLTRVLLLYTRLQQVVNACFPKPPQPSWARQLVPVNSILTEVRRFSRGI